jgi:hypothetical protein
MLRPTQVAFVLLSALTLEFATRSPGSPRNDELDPVCEPEAAPHQAH